MTADRSTSDDYAPEAALSGCRGIAIALTLSVPAWIVVGVVIWWAVR